MADVGGPHRNDTTGRDAGVSLAEEARINPAELEQFDELAGRYPLFLRGQRALSENTVRIYMDDLASFRSYLYREGLSLAAMERQMLRGYLAWLATTALDRKTGGRPVMPGLASLAS